MNKKIVVGCLLNWFLINTAVGQANLCQADENIIFSCETEHNKLLSVCGSKQLSSSPGYLQYRFGQPDKIELTYPATQVLPASAFQGRAQMFSGGGAVYLRFKIKEYDYILYTGSGKGWAVNGLVLLDYSKFTSYLMCKNDMVSEISPQLLEQLKIPQDSDDSEFFPADLPFKLISN